jgi:hypothetical protein
LVKSKPIEKITAKLAETRSREGSFGKKRQLGRKS